MKVTYNGMDLGGKEYIVTNALPLISPDGLHARLVDDEPGHLDGEDGAIPLLFAHLDLDYRAPSRDTATVAELHVGWKSPASSEDADPGYVGAAIELTAEGLERLAEFASSLASKARDDVARDPALGDDVQWVGIASVSGRRPFTRYFGPYPDEETAVARALGWAVEHYPDEGAVAQAQPVALVP